MRSIDGLEGALSRIEGEFAVTADMLREIAGNLQTAIVDGLAGKESPLKMLPSFLSQPDGGEQGEVVAIDFGGSNVRVLLVELDGRSGIHIRGRRAFSLKDPAGSYDYTSANADGNQLFDFIASQIADLTRLDRRYLLGHTFSFPCRQNGLNTATLITWTKEIRTAGVEGRDIGELLQEALERQGLTNILPQVILNDTVGTLLASAYFDRDSDIGSICGTGHNTCYVEPRHPLTGGPMIINAESGNFAGFPRTSYDGELDRASEKPGAQLLEKTAAGRYLGELTRLVAVRLAADGYMPADPASAGDGAQETTDFLNVGLHVPYSLRGEDLASILSDASAGLSGVASVVAKRWLLAGLPEDVLSAIQKVAEIVVKRSARLVAASFLGFLNHIDPDFTRRHTIAIDGSLYEKMPGYGDNIEAALRDALGEKAAKIHIRLTKDGSGAGAAIAAASVGRNVMGKS